MPLWIMATAEQMAFCANECQRQFSGERSVPGMIEAFYHAGNHKTQKPNKESIIKIARLIDPLNYGYRKTPVTFADQSHGLAPSLIPQAMDQLLEYQKEMTPAQFYQELMVIHPFQDGNGRLGAIVFNWLSGTLNRPVAPPLFTRTHA